MLLRRGHPYDAQYALPSNVVDEPFGRGTATTRYMRRRTIAPYNPQNAGGYAIPQSVKDEPPGQGVRLTKQMKRKTIASNQPAWLGEGRRVGQIAVGGIFDASALGSLGSDIFQKDSLGCQCAMGQVDPTFAATLARKASEELAKKMPAVMPGLTATESAQWKAALKRITDPIQTAAFLKGVYPFALEIAPGGTKSCKFYETKTGKKTVKSCPPGGLAALKNLLCGKAGALTQAMLDAAAQKGISIEAYASSAAANILRGAICEPQAPAPEPVPEAPPSAPFPIVPVAIGAGILALVLALR